MSETQASGIKVSPQAELAARRAVEQEATKFREFIERTSKYFGLGIAAAAAILGGIGVYFFGSSVEELSKVAKERIESVEAAASRRANQLVDEIMADDRVRAKILALQESALSQARISINAGISKQVSDALSQQTKEALNQAAKEAAKRISEASPSELFGQQSLTPPGAISAFGGARIPEGWLECNGRSIGPSDGEGMFKNLINAISDPARPGSSFWGYGDDGNGPKVSIPDLRGLFLRGARGNSREDSLRDLLPSSARLSPGSDAPSESFEVGTWQRQSMSAYTFKTRGLQDNVEGSGQILLGHLDTSQAECRPKNAAVNWIIKY